MSFLYVYTFKESQMQIPKKQKQKKVLIYLSRPSGANLKLKKNEVTSNF